MKTQEVVTTLLLILLAIICAGIMLTLLGRPLRGNQMSATPVVVTSTTPAKSAQNAEQGFNFQCGSFYISAPPISTGFVVVFLCGAFCALWAQNTGRNAWLWFFLGMFFNVITLLFLLKFNANDKRPPNPRLFSEGRKIG